MARISIDNFGGIQPRIDPTALPDNQATKAVNCRLHSTKLNPINKARPARDMAIRLEGGLTDIADAKTIVIWQRGYDRRDIIAWPGLVYVAPSNINADNRWRMIVSGDTGISDGHGKNQPCAFVTSLKNNTYDRHKIYKETPKQAVVAGKGVAELDRANLRYAFFFQSFVDEYGYESGLSDIAMFNGMTGEVIYNDGDAITWQAYDGPIPESVKKRRLYKTIAGSDTDSIRLVCEQSKGNSGFDTLPGIVVKDEDVGEEMPGITAIPPDLTCIRFMPGNFYVGFMRSDPRQICFSDVNIPTSYPDMYRYSIRDSAIGIAVAGNTAFILTKGYPWAISGTDPNGMTAAQLVSEQACVSARSICTMDGRVFYVSQDGVCVLSEGSLTSTVITRGYWDKTAWSRLNPSSALMVSYDNSLFLWFTLEDGGRDAYIIDFDVGGNPIITQHDDYASCAFVDVQNDALYFVGA